MNWAGKLQLSCFRFELSPDDGKFGDEPKFGRIEIVRDTFSIAESTSAYVEDELDSRETVAHHPDGLFILTKIFTRIGAAIALLSKRDVI